MSVQSDLAGGSCNAKGGRTDLQVPVQCGFGAKAFLDGVTRRERVGGDVHPVWSSARSGPTIDSKIQLRLQANQRSEDDGRQSDPSYPASVIGACQFNGEA